MEMTWNDAVPFYPGPKQLSSLKNEAILWVDVETTGDLPETDELLEIGAMVTDLSGTPISQGFEALVHVRNIAEVISRTSTTVYDLHERSGLWLDLWSKKCAELEQIEEEILKWLDDAVDSDTVLYFGGNSITLDRNFVRLNLPKFYQRFSHRSIDVTSLSIALQSNTEVGPFRKAKAHRALLDVEDSVLEYRYYLQAVRQFA